MPHALRGAVTPSHRSPLATRVGTPSNAVPVPPLLRAAHSGPCLAVTTVVALLAVGQDLPAARGVVVTAAVLAGQLTIGWGNDLIDADRDRRTGRQDKPLANGELVPATVRACLIGAAVVCVLLSFLVGWRSALVHLGLGVASGHLYNLVLKRTAWSWLPYAVAFGTLPAVVTLADLPHHWPPLWMMGAAAALGVAAHFLNTLPDLLADAATGVRGLPHRVGAAPSRVLATALLVVASLAAALGPAGKPGSWAWAGLAVVAVLAILASVGRGRLPFQAAMAIALVDVVLITVVAT
jgi:4-hydroxybenzoate polyprenyltransferase